MEALLTLRGFAQDTLDRWISAIGEDTLYCYPGYQNEGITSFQLLYLPEMRTEEALLKKYRMITGILRKKYGNPSYIAVYDVKNYSPGKPFYTQKWISGNELLVTSINRADRHINIQYFFEPDSIVKKKSIMKNVYMNSSDFLHRADWWSSLGDDTNRVQCTLCPHKCIIAPDRYGCCKVRKNGAGVLYSVSYGRPVALHVDPVEKKPLYHFYPGELVYSIGTMGCNLSCDFCQNWTISQAGYDKIPSSETYSPEEIVRLTESAGLRLIAFTYNEPTVYAEYLRDIAKIAVKKGLKTISVTNGYVSADIIPELYENVHAFNIDLKAFSDSFYRKYTGASFSEILETIKTIHTLKKHLEITTLIIPGLNDSREELRCEFEWILQNTGELTPLHLSAFIPDINGNITHLPLLRPW